MRILRAREVVTRTGLSRQTIWRLERAGEFPARVEVMKNRVGWQEEEIDTWIAARPRVRLGRDHALGRPAGMSSGLEPAKAG